MSREGEHTAEKDAGQCDHWNDRLPSGQSLRPIRCRREAGHTGLHLCGDTSWSEDLGTRVLPPAESGDPS